VSGRDPDGLVRRLVRNALAADDPTGWFERVYAAAGNGEATVPWDRGAPQRLLVDWARARALDGNGRRAVIVGCGLGDDAEYFSGLGFDTVAFDVSPTAVRTARQRFPESTVEYVTANLLDLPANWRQAFDLVVESLTIQSLPDPPRADAIVQVGRLVRPGGTLVAVALGRDDDHESPTGPPWALSRAEIDALAKGGLSPVRIECFPGDGPTESRWLAEFHRPRLLGTANG
jgi:SAM-dependent methyltransferase